MNFGNSALSRDDYISKHSEVHLNRSILSIHILCLAEQYIAFASVESGHRIHISGQSDIFTFTVGI